MLTKFFNFFEKPYEQLDYLNKKKVRYLLAFDIVVVGIIVGLRIVKLLSPSVFPNDANLFHTMLVAASVIPMIFIRYGKYMMAANLSVYGISFSIIFMNYLRLGNGDVFAYHQIIPFLFVCMLFALTFINKLSSFIFMLMTMGMYLIAYLTYKNMPDAPAYLEKNLIGVTVALIAFYALAIILITTMRKASNINKAQADDLQKINEKNQLLIADLQAADAKNQKLIDDLQTADANNQKLIADLQSADANNQKLIIDLQKSNDINTSLINTIRDHVAELSSTSEEMSQTAESISEGTQNQAASSEEMTASLEEMANSLAAGAENARKTMAITDETVELAGNGEKTVRETITAMKDIIKKIAIIEDIASQTNLLALNAAVEAARVGSAGKGFNVVAREVKGLAEKSKDALAVIGELSVDAVTKSENAGRLLDELMTKFKSSAGMVSEIAGAAEQQSMGIQQVNTGIQQLNSVIQQHAVASQQLASTALRLSAGAVELQDMVAMG